MSETVERKEEILEWSEINQSYPKWHRGWEAETEDYRYIVLWDVVSYRPYILFKETGKFKNIVRTMYDYKVQTFLSDAKSMAQELHNQNINPPAIEEQVLSRWERFKKSFFRAIGREQ